MNRATPLLALTTLLAGLTASAQTLASASPTYDQARWDPIHFKPAIDKATNEDCLACHKEVLEPSIRPQSPAGVRPAETLAWYQTLTTYTGDQETFHRRHMSTELAQKLMDLKCNTCHQGNDPREETANSSATGLPDLIQRKQVNPDICLMCHGQFPWQVMTGLPGPWSEFGHIFGESCNLACHGAVFRTVRHQVNYLKPEAIEKEGSENADVCYGCHGGRSWYRIPYPYPRHAWPTMSPSAPDWAKDRATTSDARFLEGVKTPEEKK